MKDKIFVTRPSLPDLDKFIPYMEKIWGSKWLTNNGQFHRQFEEELAAFLGVKYVSLFANGTLALLIALQSLGITGEVITTPFSFVATTHALHWNGIKPVFADIEPDFCNLSPRTIKTAITPQTRAILPVHVYGNPCACREIEQIAKDHDLKVIYDAAHAFGVEIDNTSICNFGDLSILSFHATKVFTTMEGGAIISHDAETKQHIDYLKNFGFAGETKVVQPGINAKMNEMQAALGVLQLKEYEQNLKKRQNVAEIYRESLNDLPGIRLLEDMPGVKHNYSYFPVFIEENIYGASCGEVYARLRKQGVIARRYFYPLISAFPLYQDLESSAKSNLKTATKLSEQVICLPNYSGLGEEEIKTVAELLKNK
jgi:dTDP-4-amino-4,6-dideoxygalactose transaminase